MYYILIYIKQINFSISTQSSGNSKKKIVGPYVLTSNLEISNTEIKPKTRGSV